MKVTPDMSTARWTFPPLIAAMSERRTAGQVEMSISPSRMTAAESGSETTVAAMDAPASHEANGRVQTACARVYASRLGHELTFFAVWLALFSMTWAVVIVSVFGGLQLPSGLPGSK